MRCALAGGKPLSALHDAGGALAGLLDSIDDGKLRQVIRLVEASGQRRTLEPALATLRPRLRQLRPRRPLTLFRLLTLPFAPALDHTPGGQWPYSIARERLEAWQKRMVERLDPPTIAAARAAIVGQAADDEAAILEAGRRCWAAAAAALAAEAVPGETEVTAVERRRIADLLAIGEQLVPLLGRLPSPLAPGDEADRATLEALLALAETGPADRLGVLAAVLLRRASQPATLVRWLLDLAPAALRPRLHPILQRLSAAHRAEIARGVADLGGAAELPLEVAVDNLSELADALVAPIAATTGKPPYRLPERVEDEELVRLRQTAAALARERYAEAIDGILLPLPTAEAANRAAAVRAREEIARRLARLGSTVRRLATDVSIHQITEAAIERLVDLEARRRGGGRALVTVDDARLIEILAGPDLAWRYLRPEAGRQVEPIRTSADRETRPAHCPNAPEPPASAGVSRSMPAIPGRQQRPG